MESYKTTIDEKEVVFEAIEMIDNHGYTREWHMDGFTGDKHTHSAIGFYSYFDEFEDITEIEEIKNKE